MTPQQIDAMKLALEVMRNQGDVSVDEWIATEKAIKEVLAEHAMREAQRLGQEIEQDPVAWRNAAIRVGEDLSSVGPDGYYDMTAQQWLDWALSVVTVHAPPPQRTEQEPAGWEVGVVDGVVTRRLAPPQRTWVGLTDEDVFVVLEKLQNLYHRPPIAIFAKAIEQTLKEKNT